MEVQAAEHIFQAYSFMKSHFGMEISAMPLLSA
jgi:hypothetical protein